jgi:glycosyltransferase involved in cell wall biosynthesis
MMPPDHAGPLRILHAPRNTASQAADTVEALRRLGHHVELWEAEPNPFGRDPDRLLGYGDRDIRRVWGAVADAVAGFDVVHFHSGQTLVPGWSGLPVFWDLPIYRALGLRVYFTFHGSDVRLGRIHDAANPWSRYFTAHPLEDDRTEKWVQVMRTYADRMFIVSVNYRDYVPDAEYLPRVLDLAAWPALPVEQRARPVILHAPTHRSTKGTELLLAALDELAAEGVDFELRLLERVSHDEVRAAIRDADILFDNVIAGSYGVVSLEAMASGRVAVANMSEALRLEHPDAPVVHVDPDTVRDRLRSLVGDVDERRRLAALGRPFVARVHDADRIAARLDEAYTAPRPDVRVRTMPDWAAAGGLRRLEQAETRVARLETELARSRARETGLRVRLGLDPAIPPDNPSVARRLVRRTVPSSVRARVRRLRGT